VELEQFRELFNPLPGNHYIQVTTKVDETSIALSKMIEAVDGEFRLVIYSDDEYAVDKELTEAKVQFVKNFKIPFRALPRDNDIVIYSSSA